MKLIKIFTAMLIVLYMLTSCTDDSSYSTVNKYNELYAISDWSYIESDDTPLLGFVVNGDKMQYHDGYLYLFSGTTTPFLSLLNNGENKIIPTLIRINLETGEMTPVCSDPLCTHSTPSCPFAGAIDYIYINGTIIYYNRTYTIRNGTEVFGQRQFCSYNLETMEMRIYKQEEIVSERQYGENIQMLFYDNYCYYYNYAYNSDDDSYSWKIMRLDLDTGDEVYLGDRENEDGLEMEYLFIIGDRVYFHDAQSIFSTDLDLNDKQVHIEGRFTGERIYTDGENIYYGVPLDEEEESYKLYRRGLDGSEAIDLGIISCEGWFLTSNYIYYFSPDRFDMEYSGGGALPFFFDAIYRCDYNGENTELVYETYQKDDTILNKYIQLKFSFVVGNYIFAYYYGVNDDNGNGLIDEDEYYDNTRNRKDFNIMRIDIINQKYELIYQNRE